VVTGKPNGKTLSGQGLPFWLGTDDGLGAIYETAITNTSASLSTWIAALLPPSISVGTINNSGTSTLSYAFRWMAPREAIHFACKAMGAEWRTNPDFTLDAAKKSNLFVDTPTTVITRNSGSRDGARAYTGVDARDIVVAQDVDGYTTKVIIVGQRGDGAEVAQGTASGSPSLKDGLNNTVVFKRLVDAPDSPAANLSNLATNVLAQYPQTRRHLTLSSDTYAVPMITRPGDNVYVYDQEAALTDPSVQLRWRGEIISPVLLRCKEYTWPLERGMGVYARRSGATPTYTDLTDFVQWEDGQPTSWVVGSRRNDPEYDPSLLGPAFLGINPAVVSRLTDPDWIAYTPTLGNITGGAVTAAYRLRGKKLSLQIAITAGTATGTSFVTATLPASLTHTGSHTFNLIASNGGTVTSATVVSGGTTVRMYKDAASTVFTAGDSVAGLRIGPVGIQAA